MVSAQPLISNFSSPHPKPLGIVPSAPITIGITITFIFHSLLSFQYRIISECSKLVQQRVQDKTQLGG